MGVKLEDLLKENNGPLLEDKSKKTIKLLLIAVGVILVLIAICVIAFVSSSATQKQKDRARQLSIDINLISVTAKNIYSEYRQDGDASRLIGLSQEDRYVTPVTLNVNGHLEEFKYGYYYLTGQEVKSLVPDITFAEDYVINYSTGDAINLVGVKWGGGTYYSVEDLSAIRDGQTPPSDYTIYINSAEDMAKMHDNPNGYYRLTRDIDMSTYSTGDGWKPVPEFYGKFDGRGYIISNLTVSRASETYCGLFGQVKSGATINNLKLENVNVSGGDYTGAIAGACSGNVTNCSISGRVSSQGLYVGGVFGLYENGVAQNIVANVSVDGSQNVGGLIGNITSGTVQCCSENGNVNGITNVGGVVGRIAPLSDVILSQLYGNGTIIATENAGGAIGQIEIQNSSKLTVQDSYVSGQVSACNNNVGGFVGSAITNPGSTLTMRDTYTTVDTPIQSNNRGGYAGYLVLRGSPIVIHCFWEKDNLLDKDVLSIGYTNNQGIEFESHTPTEMKDTAIYEDWDVEVWNFRDNSLPTLRWQ